MAYEDEENGGPTSWSHERKAILYQIRANHTELAEQKHTLRGLDDKLDRMVVELESAKIRAGLLGALAGGIPTLIGVGLMYWKVTELLTTFAQMIRTAAHP